MAVRLPLILSQPGRRDATANELVENIVAAALLVPRLDANLIGDISTIEVGSTDHLCLQGHTRDLILAGFMEIAVAQAAWKRLGLAGELIDCQQTSELIRQQAARATERRVFYSQLTLGTNVSRLLDQCQELVAAQAVQLVTIALGTNSPTAKGLPIVSAPAKTTAIPADSSIASGTIAITSAKSSPKAHAETTALRHPAEDDDADWAEIDKLVDDLDALDI